MLSSWLRDQASGVLDAARFLSRLPLPAPARPAGPLAATLRFAPLAGVVIAAGPALVLMAAAAFRLPSLVGSTLAIGGLMLVTGALHEDGWADVADGFWGARTVARKLEIMRDSRIGTYGALALGLGTLLRVAGLQAICDARGAGAAALALVAAAVVSRALMLVPMGLLGPARPDGLAYTALSGGTLSLGLPFAFALPVTAALGRAVVTDTLQVAAALVLSGAAALGLTRLARRHIGGVTGDVIGATQQAAEIAFLLTLCAGARPG